MNKKGQLEMADLAGLFLISIAVIVFGFSFTYLSPKADIKLVTAVEYEDYFVRSELLNYLGSEVDGKDIADWIVLGVEQDNLDLIDEKSKKVLKGDCYMLLIYKENEIFGEVSNYVGTCKYEMGVGELKKAALFVENFFDEDIRVELNLAGFRRP